MSTLLKKIFSFWAQLFFNQDLEKNFVFNEFSDNFMHLILFTLSAYDCLWFENT